MYSCIKRLDFQSKFHSRIVREARKKERKKDQIRQMNFASKMSDDMHGCKYVSAWARDVILSQTEARVRHESKTPGENAKQPLTKSDLALQLVCAAEDWTRGTCRRALFTNCRVSENIFAFPKRKEKEKKSHIVPRDLDKSCLRPRIVF